MGGEHFISEHCRLLHCTRWLQFQQTWSERTSPIQLFVVARTLAPTWRPAYSCPAGPNKVPRSLCQKERGCWCTRCRQSVPPGHTAVRAYVADLLKRGCYKAEEASAKQLLQTLSVVMQRPAAIELALLTSGKGEPPAAGSKSENWVSERPTIGPLLGEHHWPLNRSTLCLP